MVREPLIGTDPLASEAMREMLDEAHRLEQSARRAMTALEQNAEAKGKLLYQAVILAHGNLAHEYVRECCDDLMKAATELREAIATHEARSEMRDMILAKTTGIPRGDERDG
jgi:hypothetical protein